MLQSAGKADETSKSTRFTVWGRLCEAGSVSTGARKDSGADPVTGVTLLADVDQTESLHVAQLPVFVFLVVFHFLFFGFFFTSTPLPAPRFRPCFSAVTVSTC